MLENLIRQKIKENINCSFLEIINESHKHIGHFGDDGSGESHFKIIISSDDFKNKNKILIHKNIYKILEHEMRHKIHALAIEVK